MSKADFPPNGARAVALVGRSNVGKSSLINKLVRQRVARTSATPGKTRLANIYQVVRGSLSPLYLVDLPGYGYARGGGREFAGAIDAYFGSACQAREGKSEARSAREASEREHDECRGALLLVDPRHPGLESDLAAWRWLREAVASAAVVATKIDKLARGERIRALGELESVFEDPVLPVSAVTGEGLDELWKLIDKLTHNRNPTRRSRNSLAATAPLRLPSA